MWPGATACAEEVIAANLLARLFQRSADSPIQSVNRLFDRQDVQRREGWFYLLAGA